MFYPSYRLGLLLVLTMLPLGCTQLLVRRAVVNFSDGLEAQSLDQIKVATSEEFESKALRQPSALADLKRLRIPNGFVHVDSMERVSEGVILATIRFGDEDDGRSAQYRLIQDSQSHQWVVDDVLLGDGSGRGRQDAQSVAEQMDLILSCREVLDDWQNAPRTVKLQHCSGELHAELSQLPPVWLNRLTVETVGNGRSLAFRPEARRNGDGAVLAVPHPDGNLFLEFRKQPQGWKVQDMTIETRTGTATESKSLLATAQSLNQATRFLTGFADGDLETLAGSASPDFFSQSLKNSDFTSIEMPVAMLIASEYESRTSGDRMELILDAGPKSYMLTMKQAEIASEEGPALKEPRVDEVTIFEANGDEVKRVSAMLLSSSVANLYVSALQTRNLAQIRSMSSIDFNDRVWKTDAARHFPIMPYPEFGQGDPEVVSTDFRGEITEVTMSVDEKPFTLILRMSEGWMVVDDVLIPAHDRPMSLKSNLELILPVKAFAAAIHRDDVEDVARYSAAGLNQIVWRQLNYIPDISRALVHPLMSEVVRMTPGDGWMIVHTSDGVVSSEVKVAKEHGRYVVHDVTLVDEASPTKQFVLLRNLRQLIATGQLLPKGAHRQPIMQASGFAPGGEDNEPTPQPTGQVQQAVGFEPISPDVYR